MITVLLGTNRPKSNTARVAEVIMGIYRELGEEPGILDLAELPMETATPEVYGAKPAGLKPMVDQVLGSDGLVLVIPEYNGSYPGILKLFIDTWPYPEAFDRRPVCLVGLASGQFGALRAVEHLQQVFSYRNAHIFPPRVFLAGIHKLLDEKGQFKDAELVERLRKQAAGFLDFVRALRG